MEGFTHAHELPDDSGIMLAIKLFGPPKQDGEEVWTAENNAVGHTIIAIGKERFIYDSMAKGLRAIIKNPNDGPYLTDPFDTSSCDVPSGK